MNSVSHIRIDAICRDLKQQAKSRPTNIIQTNKPV
jgi:hypothetical protein